jgi:acyl-CoA synthetase (AMP-forming)/AMP-acid ligase II
MLQMRVEHPDIDKRDLSSLQRIIYGASPMPRAVIDRAIAKFGQHRFWQYYGQTEARFCVRKIILVISSALAGDQPSMSRSAW